MAGAGTHGHKSGEIGVVELQLVVHGDDVGLGIVAVRLGEPPGLALVDADHAERPDKFPQVGGTRQGDDQGAVGCQDAAGLGGVARPEDAQRHGRRAGCEREGLPHVRAEGCCPPVCPGGTLQGGDRQVNAQAVPVGQGVQGVGEVVASAPGQVDRRSAPPQAVRCAGWV